MTKLRCSVFILPHGMAVTGTDCTHMTGIGRFVHAGIKRGLLVGGCSEDEPGGVQEGGAPVTCLLRRRDAWTEVQNCLRTMEPSSGLLVCVCAICVVRLNRRLVLV
jgi:hypothetical protein